MNQEVSPNSLIGVRLCVYDGVISPLLELLTQLTSIALWVILVAVNGQTNPYTRTHAHTLWMPDLIRVYKVAGTIFSNKSEFNSKSRLIFWRDLKSWQEHFFFLYIVYIFSDKFKSVCSKSLAFPLSVCVDYFIRLPFSTFLRQFVGCFCFNVCWYCEALLYFFFIQRCFIVWL